MHSDSDPERRDSAHSQELTQWQSHDFAKTDNHDILTIPVCSSASDPLGARRRRRKDESLSGYIRAGIIKHQLGLAVNCILLLSMTHLLFPALRPTTAPFFSFSYVNHDTGLYSPGPNDLKLVAFWIVIFTGLRAAMMDNVLIPFAKRMGVTKPKASLRFAEQAWLFIYYSVSWTVGMSLWINSGHFLNLSATFDFPTIQITGLVKWYYLAQFAFWLQQIVVVHIEERRKDHSQMFTHHIITCMLIATSYSHYMTRIGTVVLCIMDVVDLIFPLAKMLKYAGYQTACDIAFGVFIVTWFLTRHLYYLAFCWSLYADGIPRMATGCYDTPSGRHVSTKSDHKILSNLFHAYGDRSQPVCCDGPILAIYLALLLALQVLTLIWFRMICWVAYSVLSGKPAEDSRSDDEGEHEDDEMDQPVKGSSEREKEKHPALIAPRLTNGKKSSPSPPNSARRHGRKTPVSTTPPKWSAKSKTSAVGFPGHNVEHKEMNGQVMNGQVKA